MLQAIPAISNTAVIKNEPTVYIIRSHVIRRYFLYRFMAHHLCTCTVVDKKNSIVDDPQVNSMKHKLKKKKSS